MRKVTSRSGSRRRVAVVGLVCGLMATTLAGVALAQSPATNPGVTDRVQLGNAESEGAHGLAAEGATETTSGTVEQGQLTEDYEARTVATSGRFDVRLDVARGLPLTLQLREVRPNDAWGVAYGFRVYIDGQLAYIRDNSTKDAGGGVYHSFFIETRDPAALKDGKVTVTIEGTGDEPAYFSDIWAYADLDRMVGQQGMRVSDRMVFVLGQDYLSDDVFRERLDYVSANIHTNDRVERGMAVLDYFPVRSPQQMAQNYQRYLELSREYDLPFGIESTSDWEGTPRGIPDGKGGFFADLEYQQILWSPQDQTGPDKDVYTNPAGEVQRLDEFLGEDYEPRYGLSVPNIWGNTPWLTWHHPDLNAFLEDKANESIDQIRPLLWDLQRSGEEDRILPFSTTMESTYWSRRNDEGVWDIVYTDYNEGVDRTDLFADYNPHTVAAAAADGVTLDPTDGLSEDEERWLYKNQSYPQQLFADVFFFGLPRERIKALDGQLTHPEDMLRHNIHSEIYSRKQEPYWSGVYPSIAQGVLKHARPGSEYIELNNFSPGGFYHLQKSREFGRIANPNLENSVSVHGPDKTMLLRQLYINGSRYTSLYNWQPEGDDEAKDWINPFIDEALPWDVVHDAAPDGRLSGQKLVSQSFTAGELRLMNRIDVQLERAGRAAGLRMTVREGDGDSDGRVVAMRHLSAPEIPADGWASFSLPVVEIDRDQTYTIEIEQVEGDASAYAYPTAGGDLLHRVGLDMEFERDRSLVIQWRRDAADAITHVEEQVSAADDAAQALLQDARTALADDRYVAAYRTAIKADSLRFPVLYQSDGRSTLEPFPLAVDSSFTVDVDVTDFDPGEELGFAVKGYETGPVRLRARGFDDHQVLVDGEPVPSTRHGPWTVFTLELADLDRHEVRILPRVR